MGFGGIDREMQKGTKFQSFDDPLYDRSRGERKKERKKKNKSLHCCSSLFCDWWDLQFGFPGKL